MNEYSAMTPEIQKLASISMEHGQIPAGLYDTYHVLRGLRDVNGKGVLAGLTDISTIISSRIVDGKSVPCEGELRYRGYDIKDLVAGFAKEAREEGFTEIAVLFEKVAAIEKMHEERYRKLLANVKEGLVFSRDEDMIWECSNCGHIVVGKKAPEICPVCKHPKSYFKIHATNF